MNSVAAFSGETGVDGDLFKILGEKKKTQNIRTASYSSSNIIQFRGSLEIPHRFEKTLFNVWSSALRSEATVMIRLQKGRK